MRHPRYALSQRLVHWAVALLLLFSLASGVTLGTLGFSGLREAVGLAATDLLYTSHKSIGVLILLLMLARVGLRLRHGSPAYVEPLPPTKRAASGGAHVLLYLLLLTQPILGWLATASGDFPVDFFGITLPGLIGVNEALSERLFHWHELVAWTIVAVAGTHIAAALHHGFVLRDEVLPRMTLRKGH